MVKEIHHELLKMQEELNKFNGVVDRIAKAGDVSNSLIDSSKELQSSYQKYLEEIESLFSSYMNKTYKHTQEKMVNLFETFKERQKLEEQIFENFSNLTEKNSQLVRDFVQKTTDNNVALLDKFIADAEKKQSEQNKLIRQEMNDLKVKLTQTIDSHKEKLKSEQEVLSKYVELATSTAELSKYLKSVDFPDRLSKIDKEISTIKAEYDKQTTKVNEIKQDTQKIVNDETKSQILEIVTQIKENDKQNEILKTDKKIESKVSGTKFLLILILVINIVFFVFTAIAYLSPETMKNIFNI